MEEVSVMIAFPENEFKKLISVSRDIIKLRIDKSTIRKCRIKFQNQEMDAKLAVVYVDLVDEDTVVLTVKSLFIMPPGVSFEDEQELLNNRGLAIRFENFERDLGDIQIIGG